MSPPRLEEPSELGARLAAMRVPRRASKQDYYALTLTADEGGTAVMDVCTQWVGWHDLRRRIELRRGRLVTARHAKHWAEAGQASYFVRDERQLLLFLLAGGNALVRQELAERSFPGLNEAQVCFRLGALGFVSERLLEPGALARAATPKKRMAVLRRDDRRCRICGRRPDDDVDLVLHVHHIRPWAEGGATDSRNLLTLCHTCHAGLDPHFDPDLYEHLGRPDEQAGPAAFARAVANYRRVTAKHGLLLPGGVDPS